MKRPAAHNFETALPDTDGFATPEAEHRLLQEIVRLLPAGVTVQDAQGRLLIVNDAAAAQLRLAEGEAASSSPYLEERRQTGLELLRAGQTGVAEECVEEGKTRQVLLTNHRP